LLDVKVVHQRLSEAFLISGISRRVVIAPHKPRIQLSESLSTQQTLERYLDSQPEWQGLKNELLKHGSLLEQELEASK
jgi:hypothetical protein